MQSRDGADLFLAVSAFEIYCAAFGATFDIRSKAETGISRHRLPLRTPPPQPQCIMLHT